MWRLGFGLDLGIIDDPIKGRAEASSKLIRDKTWNWLVDDFFSRFADHAGLLMIMTRWHARCTTTPSLLRISRGFIEKTWPAD